ncbi:MAG TPA: TIGR04013 family B12-binding domain/radical SAM domain-containing protein [Candidatus Ozemobacteraceae bacterium]|nr:TIGR04013 family B12-binding domain/radical SAM domain-containing protein [Candidatus Ozemobacteraceae bacterium]
MTAEYPSHTLLLRTHNYNRVSFGALLGACPEETLKRIRPVLWESDAPPPPELLTGRVLLLYSFMMPHKEAVEPEVRNIRALVTENNRSIDIWAGGAEATLNTSAVETMGFDLILAGEGEETFPLLLKQWLDGGRPTGLHSSPPGRVDLDRFPGFHPLARYLPPIELSRGCIYNCAFCAVPALHRGTLRHRSVATVLEIASAYLQHATARKRIKFLASNAFAYGSTDGHKPNPDALYALLSGLKRIGVPEIHLGSFPSEVRPDFVTRDILELVRPFLSNNTIVMGIQSPSDDRLRSIGRGHTIGQAVRAIELLREFHFRAHVDFIIGMPGETPAEQDELLTFMERIVHDYGVRIHMHTFMALAGARWADKVAEPITLPARDRLRALTRAGVLDGWWENQIAYSRRHE